MRFQLIFSFFPNPVMSELQIQKPNDVTIYSIEILDVSRQSDTDPRGWGVY